MVITVMRPPVMEVKKKADMLASPDRHASIESISKISDIREDKVLTGKTSNLLRVWKEISLLH
jgi:hypothetical protein